MSTTINFKRDLEEFFEDDVWNAISKRSEEENIPKFLWVLQYAQKSLKLEIKAGEYMEEAEGDPLEDLDGGRAATALLDQGVETVQEVLEMDPDEIEDTKGAGPKSARKLAETLEEEGYVDDADEVYPEEEKEEDTQEEEKEEDTQEEEKEEGTQEEEEDTEEEERELDVPVVVEEIGGVEHTKSGLNKAATQLKGVLEEETDKSEKEIKKKVKKIFYESDFKSDNPNFEKCLSSLQNAVPILSDQKETIMGLGEDLDLEEKEVKVERPSAAFGKPLEEISAIEAAYLIQELEEELEDELDDQLDDDIFEEEDFFDDEI